jgi:hypothetical protein
MTENSDNFISYNFLFTIQSISLLENILDANNNKGNCTIIHEPKHCNIATHIATITVYVTERQAKKKTTRI